MRFALILSLALLGACRLDDADEIDIQNMEAFESFIAKRPVGEDGGNAWIEVRNSFGEWEKIALVFGFWGDDLQGCDALVTHINNSQGRSYRCSRAN